MQNNVFNASIMIVIFFCLCQPLYAWEKEYTHPAFTLNEDVPMPRARLLFYAPTRNVEMKNILGE